MLTGTKDAPRRVRRDVCLGRGDCHSPIFKLHRNIYRSERLGWVVVLRRRHRVYRAYFSDKALGGKAAALGKALGYRDALIARLPPPVMTKVRYVRNTTGVVGVMRSRERARSGRIFVRYVATWHEVSGRYRKHSFSVEKYGEREAFRLAVVARRAALREIMSHTGYVPGGLGRRKIRRWGRGV